VDLLARWLWAVNSTSRAFGYEKAGHRRRL